MSKRSTAPKHPGAHVRESVIPEGMTVTDAARRLGIGRPALSNFLNGKSALSPELAIRLEKTFGVNQQGLLEMQAAFDQHERRAADKEVAVRAFVPNFLLIKASQIESWADSDIAARDHLPVLLRKLVHSTGIDLLKVDFPGYDNAQRKGSDGFVEADGATPWIPKGKSYWEFGTDKRPSTKAEADYRARLESIERAERAVSTFVSVTPRNWPGKAAWEKKMNQSRDWNAVRVFDASDLEQWLEQSVPAQIWFAEKIGRTFAGFGTLEQSWRRWATASEPQLTPALFAPSIEAHRATFKSWLDKPSEKPFVVAADSRDEALGFLACLIDEDEFRQFRDLAAVFTSSESLRKLVESLVPFIPIVHSEEVERELAGAYRRLHCIVFRPRNAVDTKADVTLDLLRNGAFKAAVVSMGIDESDVDRLARESGRSPTILRRRLSKNSAIRTPAWAGEDHTSKSLVPLALIGAWHAGLVADCEIVSRVADRKYEAIEDEVARLLRYDDSPVWSVGEYRGVASKIDALFAIASRITPQDLDRFFESTRSVLTELDPAVDLPEEQQSIAELYGKFRRHSRALRDGVCETLVILSVHGNELFQRRLGIDLETRVGAFIRGLLTPLSLEKLLSHNHELPLYAEAAPKTFLEIIGEDLRGEDPIVLGLMKPVQPSSLFGSPWRTGLLWALESLAWDPRNLPQVVDILARLCRPKINDNWGNKPDASLQSIFRSWMPQTSAALQERCSALENLCKSTPEVGWEVCIEQIRPGTRIGHHSYRPRWRSDASGAGQIVRREVAWSFCRKALNLMVDWPSHDQRTLGELVEALQGMPEEDQIRVLDLVDAWCLTADGIDKATLRDRIRRSVLTRRGGSRKLDYETRNRARRTYEKLRPDDPVVRHAWLFAEQWVQETADEAEEEALDHQERWRRIDELRREAITEIWSQKGFEGVKKLVDGSNAADLIGRYLTSCVLGAGRLEFILSCLCGDGFVGRKAESCLAGFLLSVEDGSRLELIRIAAQMLDPSGRRRLFHCSPFRSSTWRLLDEFGEQVRTEYWRDVNPVRSQELSVEELNELIDHLQAARRPRAAFDTVQWNFDHIETSRLLQLLRDIVMVDAEPVDHYPLDSYDISEALSSLDGRAGVTRDAMAGFEFMFISLLERSKHGIPNLEREISESPALFAEAVCRSSMRPDDGSYPSEWRIANQEQKAEVAATSRRLLSLVRRIPGTADDGAIDAIALRDWMEEVRRLCRKYARVDDCDKFLGGLLARSPVSEGAMWPCEAVCKAMEAIGSRAMSVGFRIEVCTSRGFQWRGEGGEPERVLFAKYDELAKQIRFVYPFVAGILDDIADSFEREARRCDSDSEVANRLDP